VTPDGRFVAFASRATNLIDGDTNGVDDVFLRDRVAGTTERVSLNSSGAQGNSESSDPSLSADRRFIAFVSHASNLVGGRYERRSRCFLRDRLLGATERVAVPTDGAQATDRTLEPSFSPDGRFVAFSSPAPNLVARDTNGTARPERKSV
jgi:Tol biopolymer transport system component